MLREPTNTTVAPRALGLLFFPLALGFLRHRWECGEGNRSEALPHAHNGMDKNNGCETHLGGGGGLTLPFAPTTMTRAFEPPLLTPPTTTEPPLGVGTDSTLPEPPLLMQPPKTTVPRLFAGNDSTLPAPKKGQFEHAMSKQLTPFAQHPNP